MRALLIAILSLTYCSTTSGQEYTIRLFAGTGPLAGVPASRGKDGIDFSRRDDNGPATSAQLSKYSTVAVDGLGNAYISNTVRGSLRKVSNGIITTIVGVGNGDRFSGDNGPAISASVSLVRGITVDAVGNIYFSDSGNHRIRRVSNGTITTVAGTGNEYGDGDDGPATNAALAFPAEVALDSAGDLLIVVGERVRKIAKGIITTIAGNGFNSAVAQLSDFSGDDGPATKAWLASPQGIAVDSADVLYIADTDNNRIRRVSAGVITTIAGDGYEGFGGDNGPATRAQLSHPTSVAVDHEGNLYIADTNNNRVRKVSKGVITTIAGNGNEGFGGDNGPAATAQLSHPTSIAVDRAGKVFVVDSPNRRARVLIPTK